MPLQAGVWRGIHAYDHGLTGIQSRVDLAKVGPMLGFFGTIADIKAASVCVEFSLFGRLTRSWLRADQVEAV